MDSSNDTTIQVHEPQPIQEFRDPVPCCKEYADVLRLGLNPNNWSMEELEETKAIARRLGLDPEQARCGDIAKALHQQDQEIIEAQSTVRSG